MIKIFSWRRRKRLLDRPFKHLLVKGIERISFLTAEKLPSIQAELGKTFGKPPAKAKYSKQYNCENNVQENFNPNSIFHLTHSESTD